MKFSDHAMKRSQQRGIPKDYIEMIMEWGIPKRKPGNVLEYRLPKKKKDQIIKHLKHLIHAVDKCGQKAVLFDPEADEIITVYNLY